MNRANKTGRRRIFFTASQTAPNFRCLANAVSAAVLSLPVAPRFLLRRSTSCGVVLRHRTSSVGRGTDGSCGTTARAGYPAKTDATQLLSHQSLRTINYRVGQIHAIASQLLQQRPCKRQMTALFREQNQSESAEGFDAECASAFASERVVEDGNGVARVYRCGEHGEPPLRDLTPEYWRARAMAEECTATQRLRARLSRRRLHRLWRRPLTQPREGRRSGLLQASGERAGQPSTKK